MGKKTSIIITLYKTPKDKLENLKSYNNYPLFIFEQNANEFSKKFLHDRLKMNFKYFFSKENIGLSKSSNFLLKKVKTRYCLFTQADIKISSHSIQKMEKIFNLNKDIIFVTPNFSKPKITKKKDVEYKKKINAACILIDVKKIKKLGFFDEDYFLYWEDIDLMDKINRSKYSMVLANNIRAHHDGNQSSKSDYRVRFIRNMNYIYGEFVYDLKHNNFRFVKLFRKLFQNLFLFFFNIIRFQLKDSFTNLANLKGLIKFIIYYLKL